jgi:very-short-patch-repair endonuclease
MKIEHAIPTSGCTKEAGIPPFSYKVDLADTDLKLAIEVDGKGHLRPRMKILDAKKTTVLSSLGWTVLRFTNEEVDRDLSGCLARIQSTTSTLKETTTTLQKAS